jgi:c(7)-type cytochrome triheme protein
MSLMSSLKTGKKKIIDLVKRHPKLTIMIFIVAFGIFIFSTIELLHYTTDPQFCKKCHPSEEPGPFGEVASWEKSNHAKAGVSCIDCHAQPGFAGYMRAKMGGLGDVWAQMTHSKEHIMHILKKADDPIYAAQLVKNDVCLFCHTDEMNKKIRGERRMTIGIAFRTADGVVNPEFRKKYGLPDIIAEGVRPETAVDPHHKKHLEMGFNCVDCHAKIAHNGITGYRSSMPICFACHDVKRNEGKNPPKDNDCTACHRDAVKIVPAAPIVYKPKDAEPVSFGHEKHTAKFKCTDCHDAIWPMKKGSVKMTMDQLYAGKYCGTCHNEKKAFASTDCAKCHIEQKKK